PDCRAPAGLSLPAGLHPPDTLPHYFPRNSRTRCRRTCSSSCRLHPPLHSDNSSAPEMSPGPSAVARFRRRSGGWRRPWRGGVHPHSRCSF
ncbi:hypothetical protein PMAYCL1PPCAC_33210, partial [Pristionchus mayeri]